MTHDARPQSETWTRDQLAARYFEQLPFEPYPVQEEALLAWFTCDQGVLVCAPTGTGKTLIAEAAMFEALHNGTIAYYTTPLIALTEQKFAELQEAAVRWGFSADDVGLVTGNRRVNPEARILVVVAEILFNRLLRPDSFDMVQTTAVVMDEFHSFNDPERGIVWELTLGLLPAHVRTLLLSATVGNAYEFTRWLEHSLDRSVELVQSDERKIPLTYVWVGDELLNEHVENMVRGDDEARKTPALVFCFNRDECWNVAEQLKGKSVVGDDQKKLLSAELDRYDWSDGAGPKLRQLLMRGVGVHHAGVLPKYKRIVESLFQQKLLSVTVCTETLAAGINLPARSVVLPGLFKGPPGKKKLIDPSSAHQIFGRAGRPQYDTQGYVFALAHEDDVKIQRWREKYDQIPEDTKDPQLRKAKKQLKKKMPTRRNNQQYWEESHFEKLKEAKAAKLSSRGHLPWRLLAYMLDASPDIEPIRRLVAKRLLTSSEQERAQDELNRMLLTLWRAGYVELEPHPPRSTTETDAAAEDPLAAYRPEKAYPTDALERLIVLRGVNPLYGVFLVNHLGIADNTERMQAWESLLEMPGSVARHVRVPKMEEMPPGPLATTRLDVELLKHGLATPEELGAADEDERETTMQFGEETYRVYPLTLAEKLKRLFDFDFPDVHEVRIVPVWAAGELLEYGADFNKFITSRRLQKQEGVIFRHLLRLVLLLLEFRELTPPDCEADSWQAEIDQVVGKLTDCCRQVDATSTDKALEQVADQD